MINYFRRSILLSNVEVVTPNSLSSIQTKELTPIPPARLYRHLLKLYICKFDSDTETIIKAWKQTKYEFWNNRNVDASIAEKLNIKGQQIYEAIRAGVIPIYHNSKSGQTYYKYDKDTLDAAHNHIDPISAEEFIRRFHTYMNSKDVNEIITSLKDAGRWDGPDNLRDEDVFRYKSKHKSKCTSTEDNESARTMENSGKVVNKEPSKENLGVDEELRKEKFR